MSSDIIGVRCRTGANSTDGVPADPLGRRVGDDQLRELRLVATQLLDQLVVFGVADRGRVELVVVAVVLVDLLPQRDDPGGDVVARTGGRSGRGSRLRRGDLTRRRAYRRAIRTIGSSDGQPHMSRRRNPSVVGHLGRRRVVRHVGNALEGAQVRMASHGTLEDFSSGRHPPRPLLRRPDRRDQVRWRPPAARVSCTTASCTSRQDEHTDAALAVGARATGTGRRGRLDRRRSTRRATGRSSASCSSASGAIHPDLLASVVLSVAYDPLIASSERVKATSSSNRTRCTGSARSARSRSTSSSTEVRRRVREVDEWGSRSCRPSTSASRRCRTLPGDAHEVTLRREDWELMVAARRAPLDRRAGGRARPRPVLDGPGRVPPQPGRSGRGDRRSCSGGRLTRRRQLEAVVDEPPRCGGPGRRRPATGRSFDSGARAREPVEPRKPGRPRTGQAPTERRTPRTWSWRRSPISRVRPRMRSA